jgi:hypothetical protein
MPVHIVNAKLRSAEGMNPAGTMIRKASARTISAAAKFRKGGKTRITDAQ